MAQQKKFPGIFVFATLAVGAMLFASPGHAQLAPPDQAGPWDVGRTTFTVDDPRRPDRQIEVDVWYPVDPEDAAGAPASVYDLVFATLESPTALDAPPGQIAGPRPLVVMSHGSQGIRFQSYFLTETLASHGFVVAAPDHTGNTAFDLVFGTTLPVSEMVIIRPQDISLVIDTMLARNADQNDAFFGRIDSARIGVMGHSFGGYTTLAMASGFDTVPADPRVRVLAPFAPASGFLSDNEFAAIDLPTLLIGGTADITTPIALNSAVVYSSIPALPRFRVDILEAGHQSFTNICTFADVLLGAGIPPTLVDFILGAVDEGCAPDLIPIEEAHRVTNLYIVAFMHRFLAETDPRYGLYLTRLYARTAMEPVRLFRRTR